MPSLDRQANAKRCNKTSPKSVETKSLAENLPTGLHARRPFGEHVLAWVGPQQSTLVSATKSRRMLIGDGDDNDHDDTEYTETGFISTF